MIKEVIEMATKIISASFNGIDGEVVYVEVDINKGLPSFSIVGDNITMI
jgi:magnesium chelatase family protein